MRLADKAAEDPTDMPPRAQTRKYTLAILSQGGCLGTVQQGLWAVNVVHCVQPNAPQGKVFVSPKPEIKTRIKSQTPGAT